MIVDHLIYLVEGLLTPREELLRGLMEARSLIADPARFTTKGWIIDKNGRETTEDPAAYSPGGALMATDAPNAAIAELEKAARALFPDINGDAPWEVIEGVGEKYGHLGAMAIYDLAIANVRRRVW